ncbi:hypothetical protein [Sulfitobacter sp. R18_1]|uniref:hypothetical protein n=1 Tax=Sulfitobacter sp. R18_1 TaxID=2821104 RepID=UPI001ADA9EB8|nr:hypothetical protein [Sulfitobacter sp. R18_1]MBO9427922.1 hypothetical protein [Sulfitobacter sp. R18_1]
MLDCHDLDGEWLATVTGGFRTRGKTMDEAVRKMRDFLQDERPEVYEAHMDALETYSHPMEPSGTVMDLVKMIKERHRKEAHEELCEISKSIDEQVAINDTEALSKLTGLNLDQGKAITKLQAEDFTLNKVDEVIAENGIVNDLLDAIALHLTEVTAAPEKYNIDYKQEISLIYEDLEEYLPPEPKF